MLKKICSCFAVLLVAGATVVAGDVDLKDVKCVVASAKNAAEGKSADYKEGKVYFCCDGCAGKFNTNKKKFAASANHQLVATKQYEQKACPFSGGSVDETKFTMVAGAKVGFCCDGCKGKVESAKDDAAKVKLVFGNKTFSKGFKKASKDES